MTLREIIDVIVPEATAGNRIDTFGIDSAQPH